MNNSRSNGLKETILNYCNFAVSTDISRQIFRLPTHLDSKLVCRRYLRRKFTNILLKFQVFSEQIKTQSVFLKSNKNGYSDVGDNVMSVTLWWWQILDIGDRFNMLGTIFVMLVILSVSNWSPRSKIGHQHLKVVTNTFRLQHPSPTSM